MPGPLDGIRILDLTTLINGPWATVLLSDMGAEVVKIEDPTNPDPYRGDVQGGVDPATGMHTYFETMNRGKRSITLDLKKTEGQRILHRLARDADVVISNFRPSVVERLGADYKSLVLHNPKIITITASGLGRLGPDAETPVIDLTGQARSGFLALTSEDDGSPRYVGGHALADQVGAMMLAYGTVLAVLARERFGIGQDVDVSQLGSMLAMQSMTFNNHLIMGADPLGAGVGRPVNPVFNSYRARNGKWLSLACFQFNRYWRPLCRALGLVSHADAVAPDASEEGVARARGLVQLLVDAFAADDRDSWLEKLRAEDIVCAPVQDYADVERDPQVLANDLIVELEHPQFGRFRQVGIPVKLSATPGAVTTTAPEHGQHTEEVLLASGYTWDDIRALRGKGAI